MKDILKKKQEKNTYFMPINMSFVEMIMRNVSKSLSSPNYSTASNLQLEAEVKHLFQYDFIYFEIFLEL